MSRSYTAQHLVTGAVAGQRLLAVNNPADSLVDARVVCVTNGLVTSSRLAVLLVERYPGLATGGAAATLEPGDNEATPTFPRIARASGGDPAPTAVVLGGAFSLPGAARTLDTSIALESRAGEDSCHLFDAPIVVRPGETAVLTLLEADSYETVRVSLTFEEALALPTPHHDDDLPAAGAWASPTLFDLPDEWTSVVFRVAYTAAEGSTNARPKWRIVWNDGAADLLQPIAQQEIDVTGAPIAFRAVYDLEERRANVTAAAATDTFTVTAERLPGARSVRLEIAELGDTTNPGGVVVTVSGS